MNKAPLLNLVEPLPKRLERQLASMLTTDEPVLVKLKGAFKEALVCTDKRVIIIKGGLVTGQLFGTATFQLPYQRITSVEIEFHLLTGYLEVSAGGVQSVKKSYWGQGSKSAAASPNTITILRKLRPRFQQAAVFIMEQISGAQQVTVAAQGTTSQSSPIHAQIGALWDLKEKGAITEQEFAQKKSELLARL
jgi:hypothetical protein